MNQHAEAMFFIPGEGRSLGTVLLLGDLAVGQGLQVGVDEAV